MIKFLNLLLKLIVKFMRDNEWIDTTYFGLDNFQINYLGEVPPTTTPLLSTADSKTTRSEDTPQNNQVVSHHKTTNIILGIFFPLIIMSLFGLGYFYWKRSRKIIRLLKNQQQGVAVSPPIKFSKERDEVSGVEKKRRQTSAERQPIVDDGE